MGEPLLLSAAFVGFGSKSALLWLADCCLSYFSTFPLFFSQDLRPLLRLCTLHGRSRLRRSPAGGVLQTCVHSNHPTHRICQLTLLSVSVAGEVQPVPGGAPEFSQEPDDASDDCQEPRLALERLPPSLVNLIQVSILPQSARFQCPRSLRKMGSCCIQHDKSPAWSLPTNLVTAAALAASGKRRPSAIHSLLSTMCPYGRSQRIHSPLSAIPLLLPRSRGGVAMHRLRRRQPCPADSPTRHSAAKLW